MERSPMQIFHFSFLAPRFLALALVLSSLAGSAVAAPEGDATQTVRKVNTSISKVLTSKNREALDEEKALEQARAKLGNFLDIDELGKRAMKDHWATLSPAQRTEFLTLLRNLIETNYLKGLRSNLSYSVKYLGESPVGKHVRVQTLVKGERRGRPLTIEVDYLLSKTAEGWRTFDISTDGIGLVENYRSMFNTIIAKSGPDELLARMRKKLAALSK